MEVGRTTSPHLEFCTVLGACKEEQGGWVATIDEFLQRVVQVNLFVAPFEAFSFLSFLVANLKGEKKKEN